jgi:hypothetical protein
MKVRWPECDEQPSKPSALYARLNQTTMLSGVMGPPRSERMTGPLTATNLSRVDQRLAKVGMKGHRATAALFRDPMLQLKGGAYLAAWVEDYFPG